MNPPSPFFTATMARLYAEQGYLRKAAQVYRHLLELEPHREDLSRCLQTVEEQIALQTHPSRRELGLMLREWAELLRKQKELKSKGNTQEGGSDENQGET